MGPIRRPPLLDEIQHCLAFPTEDPVDRVAAWCPIDQGADIPVAGPPPVHPDVGHTQGAARPSMRPALHLNAE